MDLRQLRAVVTVAEYRSVTKAAHVLCEAQPVISRLVIALEAELGVRLFDRTRHGMNLTDAGSMFVIRAQRILVEAERARAEVRPVDGAVTGIATIGLLDSVEQVVAGRLVAAIARKHPGIEVRLATAYSGHLENWLDEGDLDISLLYNLTTGGSVRVIPLLRDRLWAVAPSAAALSLHNPVTLETVMGQPFIMPIAGQHGIRVLIDEARTTCDVQPTVIAQANSMSLQLHLVEALGGWTILPAVGAAAAVTAGRVSAAPLSEPEIIRTVGLATPHRGRMAPAVEVAATELLITVRAVVSEGCWPSAELLLPD